MPGVIGNSDMFHFSTKRHRRQDSGYEVIIDSSCKNGLNTAQRRKLGSDFHLLNALKTEKMTRNLRDFLKKKSRSLAFRDFLRSEFSEENLDFWTEVETYKKQKSSKQCKLAPLIYQTYIEVDAPREVNIDAAIRANTKNNLDRPDSSTFDIAQSTVFLLMERDSFRRFLRKESNDQNNQKKTYTSDSLKSVFCEKFRLSAKLAPNNLTCKQDGTVSSTVGLSASEANMSLIIQTNLWTEENDAFSVADAPTIF